jgi:hypothetical protein
MKKIIILMIGVLIASCSNDNSENEVQVLTKNIGLSTITKKYYNETNFNYHIDKLYFKNEKLSVFRYQNGTYDGYKYNDANLLSSIEKYDSKNSALSTTNFYYDSLGRIIEIDEVPNSIESSVSRKSTIAYNTDKIIVTAITRPYLYLETFELLLNNTNEIISYNITEFNGRPIISNIQQQYNYKNGNLTNINSPRDIISYSTIKNDFSYKKNIFGKEWKKNNLLINLLTYYRPINNIYERNIYETEVYQTEVSENLISDYTKSYAPDSYYNIKADYEFNDQNKITKEIKNFTVTTKGDTKFLGKSEFIYEYN